MMSPRSFKYSSRPRPPPSATASSPSPSVTSNPSSLTSATTTTTSAFQKLPYSSVLPSKPAPEQSTSHTTATIPHYSHLAKHVKSRSDVTVTPSTRISNNPVSNLANTFITDENMAKRKNFSPVRSISPSSVNTDRDLVRPPTPTSPVQIPTKRDSSHPQMHHSAYRRKQPKDAHTPESIAPSVAALLAVTDIPRQRRSQRRKLRSDEPLTVEDIIDQQQIAEKELSWSLTKSPLDVLLSPPEDLDDFFSVTESNVGSQLSTRTISADSIPSLGNSFATDLVSSIGTPSTPGSATSRRSRGRPMRKSLEPVRSPPHVAEEHPLATGYMDVDEDFDFSDLEEKPVEEVVEARSPLAFKPLRAVFKSNLTASLRALRSAAKSFSAINFPSIPPDDFLTRSILTIDPNVPYTDERRPPVSEEMPSAEVRRYLNPTTSARIDTQPAPLSPSAKFSASIQMQTYKVQRSRSGLPSARNAHPPATQQSSPPSNAAQSPRQQSNPAALPPNVRQREMRENCDFIRIAVMEMAMRKRGKLDDQQPGRARWALPPRKTSAKPYEIGTNGIPIRWIPVSI
ncbi:hypothetical protein HJFPF1_11846 [Paramyrothecium foliicola]|nr:hypothetical protein HJFPF1_11846 [Paramyrothecium foliicola]